MTFKDIGHGDQIFIDANIFVYHFNGTSVDCKHLMTRCLAEEIMSYTSTAVLAEVLHRLMISEAVSKGYIKAKNPVQQLKEHPEVIKQLAAYSLEVAKIPQLNVKILPLTQTCLDASAAIRQTEGLLTNDSLIVATMREAGLTKLATHDRDFNRISWLTVYKPEDV